MVTPMFGIESECAIAGINAKGPMPRENLVNQFVRAARHRLAHLPDTCSPSSMFLANGARFYIDCGLHPEMTTPECTTPFELARYIKAGERILEGLTQEVQTLSGEGAEIMCFRCNVDYSGSGTTWGCHESYLHHVDPSILPEQLMSHLVTRVIYTGAGGFNPLADGLEFCVAPRLMHIQHAISGDSTGNRGIFHTKNEPLARGGNNRLHILCGESLCSETAIVIKTGATALVTAMAEEGLKPGKDLQLASPLDSLRAVATDITCKRKLRLAAGSEATAIEIQRRLLDLAERHLGVLPPWGGEICAMWRRVLDRLEGAPDSVSTVLDWAIKRRLFHDRAQRSGLPVGRFAFLNSVIQKLNTALTNAGANRREIGLPMLLGPKSPIPEEAARLGGALAGVGLGWGDLERFLNLRDEFFQIDTRFGQLGPRGIFAELDRCGVLDHKVPAVDGVEAAMSQPPAVGRAKLRGETIRRLSGRRRAQCTWTTIYGADGRTLDLSDPFATAEVWTVPPAPAQGPEAMPPELLDEFGDPGRLRQMLDAFRGRHGRTQTRAQGPPETPESSNR